MPQTRVSALRLGEGDLRAVPLGEPAREVLEHRAGARLVAQILVGGGEGEVAGERVVEIVEGLARIWVDGEGAQGEDVRIARRFGERAIDVAHEGHARRAEVQGGARAVVRD